MNDFQTQKEALLHEQVALTKQLSELGIQNPANPNDWKTVTLMSQEADPNSVADQAESYLTDRATLAALETRFANISIALEKIEAGTYGICEVGKEPIDETRLAANPAARTCRIHMDSTPQAN